MHSEHIQACKIELFVKIVKRLKAVDYINKRFILGFDWVPNVPLKVFLLFEVAVLCKHKKSGNHEYQ